MKKIASFVLTGVLILALVGCGGGKKLSGSYNCLHRYDFTITENGRGDYGGKCEEYSSGDLEGEYSWYVKDNIVFLDGEATFGYYPEKDYIYKLGSSLDVTLYDDMTCVANESIYTYDLIGMRTRIDVGTEGEYVVEDNIVYFYWGSDALFKDVVARDEGYLLVDGAVYSIFGGPN